MVVIDHDELGVVSLLHVVSKVDSLEYLTL